MAKAKRAKAIVRRAAGGVKKAAAKGRRNYRKSNGGNGFMGEVIEAGAAFTGGTLYPFLVSLAQKYLPEDMIPIVLVKAGVAVVEHVGLRMVFGGMAPRAAKAAGNGAMGALGADINIPKQLGLYDAMNLDDYIGNNGGRQMGDYIGNAPHLGERRSVAMLGSIGRPHLGDQIGRRHHHKHTHRMSDAGYGASYGASYG